ncbi:DUF6882 domain-containing protein [Methylovulum psychrotolerans]|uniref:Uncharacterized protein n=1 Tax=Methylovulum psychrotolerans TaxID=1704499 RepID=A0A2S5CSR3_9GAMM|nr:DUF6882 domain-containing protein [Methylovulum psychrotolerans]POZ53777.1 hypothetical protein AADEFJLK_00818 [Methylovulum psychrotolerans]
MTNEEFGDLLTQALAELTVKQDHLQDVYDLGQWASWWCDQEAELLQFFDGNDRVAVEADIINLGSYSAPNHSWKWGWSNPPILKSLREKALPIKELAKITGFPLFANEAAFELDEPMVWEMMAIVVKHLGAMGCYRAPTENGLYIFLAINALRILTPRTLH